MPGRAFGEEATAIAIGNRDGTYSATQPSSVATSGATPGGDGNSVASSAGNRSITISRVSIVVPCLANTASAMAAVKTTRPRSCNRTKEPVQTGLSGEQLAPVIATSRPPSGSRAKADAICRKAASAMLFKETATTENGGF